MILLPVSASPGVDPATPVQSAPEPAGGVFDRLVAAITPHSAEGTAKPDPGEDEAEPPEVPQVETRPEERLAPDTAEMAPGHVGTAPPDPVATSAPLRQAQHAVAPTPPIVAGIPVTPTGPEPIGVSVIGAGDEIPSPGPHQTPAGPPPAVPAPLGMASVARLVAPAHGATLQATALDRPLPLRDGAALPRARTSAEPAAATPASTSAAVPQPAATAPVAPLVPPARAEVDLHRHPSPLPDTGPAPVDGPPLASQPGSTAADSVTLRPATASEVERPVLRQIALALSTLSDGQTELRLSPEELGRVRLSLSTSDGMVTLAVQADRPETADLIRRNLDLLAQDFREMGFAGFEFSFGSDTPNQQPQTGGAAGAQAAPDQSDDPAQTILLRGLDLRL